MVWGSQQKVHKADMAFKIAYILNYSYMFSVLEKQGHTLQVKGFKGWGLNNVFNVMADWSTQATWKTLSREMLKKITKQIQFLYFSAKILEIDSVLRLWC